jgi:hypothetical protein
VHSHLAEPLLHGRMVRGGHGLHKVLHGTTMPYPSTPYPSKAVSGVARLQGGQPTAVFYPFGHPTPYAHANLDERSNAEDVRVFGVEHAGAVGVVQRLLPVPHQHVGDGALRVMPRSGRPC